MTRLGISAAWMRSRAVNVLRRPLAMAVVGGSAAVLVLAALVLVPGGAYRHASVQVATIPERPDTLPAAGRLGAALAQLDASDSLLRVARLAAAAPPPQPVDTFPPHLVARRDSLAAVASALGALIARSESAPLPASYRALGESQHMAAAPGVRVLLDSLAELERDREAFGAVSGVDPMYIALTARVNAIGRAIIREGQARLAAVRGELLPLLPPPPPPRPALAIDTLRLLEERAAAEETIVTATEELERLRNRHREIDVLERRARELREVGASFAATFGAALVVGLAFGFAVLLLIEVRDPRVADVRDAEQAARARVLAVVRTAAIPVERTRRRADLAIPAVLDPFAQHYRLLHLRLTTREQPLSAVTVTGDVPEISAVVAINLAAFDVGEARSAIVIDGDPEGAGVARALAIAAEPGLTDLTRGDLAWPDVVQYVNIGRDQVLAVLPSGRRTGEPPPARATAVRQDLARLSARHDFIVFSCAPERTHAGPQSILLSPEVVVCVRLGHTRIRTLKRIVQQLRDNPMAIHGLLIWDADKPELEPARYGARSPGTATPAPAAV